MYIVFFRGQKILGHAMIGLDNQPLFGKGARALLGEERRPDEIELKIFPATEVIPSLTRGPLGCLLGFGPSGPKPCGGH